MATTTRDTTSNIRHCQRCGAAYDWRRSASSSLKMTYCSSLCERGGLGFTIEGLLEFVGVATAREPQRSCASTDPEWRMSAGTTYARSA